MKNYSKWKSLPLGSIKAEGWLREQLERNRDGMGGHLGDLEPQMVWDPYTTKKTDDKWGLVKTGWGAEISGNYWFGFMFYINVVSWFVSLFMHFSIVF